MESNGTAFGFYPKWVKLDNQGKSINPIKDVMTQLPIKATWMFQEVILDKGIFLTEYALK